MSQLVQRIRKLPRFPKFDFDRFMGWVAYIIWFYSILCLLLVDLTLFDFAFLMPGSLAFWQEIFRSPPTIPLTISFMPKPEAGLYIAMLLLIGAGFLWFTYKCGKQAIVDFLAWKNFSYMRQLTLHHSIRRQLVFLYTLARFENERFHFAQQRKSGEIREKQLSDDNISSNDKIQCVGLFSWFYMFALNYLLPPSAVQEREAFFTYLRQFPNMVQLPSEEGSKATTPPPSIPPSTLSHNSGESETTSTAQAPVADEQESSLPSPATSGNSSDTVQSENHLLKKKMKRSGSIYAFAAQPIIFLGEDERISLRIKDSRHLSLFMYLAVYTRQHTVHVDDIINAIYEQDETRERDDEADEDVKKLRRRFHKDVRSRV